MLRAGAVCVDIYSAFIYRGWSVARDINHELMAAGGPSIARTG
jgi:dihydroorotate dehydrogenase (fumarate)/dihydroorotate dehydrogenase